MRHDAPRATSLAVMLVFVAVACGDANPTPPRVSTTAATAAPTAAPTPSPSSVDVAAAFIKIIGSPSFSATADISGTVSFGATAGELTGDATLAGSSSSLTMRIEVNGLTQETESISIGTKNWNRDSPGPWLAAPDTGPLEGSLAGSLAAIASVEDVGVVPRNDRPLHHLQPEGGGEISPAIIGFDVERATDAAFVLDLFTTDDGTPVVIGISGSWTQATDDASVPVRIELEFVLSDVGVPQTIAPPEDVWVLNTSKTFPYRMAHPAGWTVEASKTEDAYATDGQPYVYVAAQKVDEGTTLDDFSSALQASYKDDFGQPTSAVDGSLGGQPSDRLVYEFVNDQGQDVTFVDDVTVRGRTGWEVFLVTAGGASDIPVFDQFVATFAFTD